MIYSDKYSIEKKEQPKSLLSIIAINGLILILNLTLLNYQLRQQASRRKKSTYFNSKIKMFN